MGACTSIQDGTIAHATGGESTTTIGARVVCGHRVILHGCKVGSDCLLGMGSTLLDNCEIGDECVIGAGALVPVGRKIPPRSLVLGIPGRVVREITAASEEQSKGIEQIMPLEMTEEEKAAFIKSSKSVQELVDVLAKNK